MSRHVLRFTRSYLYQGSTRQSTNMGVGVGGGVGEVCDLQAVDGYKCR